MLTVLLAPAPAAAGIDLLGGGDAEEDTSDDASSREDESSGARADSAGSQPESASGSDSSAPSSADSSEQNLGRALGDVVDSVTGTSEPEQQAAADGQEPQQVTPEGQGGSPSEPAQPQPQSNGGGAQGQTSPPQASESASSGGGSQPAVPSGPRRAARPGVSTTGQPPAAPGGSGFGSADRGAYQPRAPEVLGEDAGTQDSGSDVAALPGLPLVDEPDTDAAEVPDEYVAAASALLIILAGAHSLHATRRFGTVHDQDR